MIQFIDMIVSDLLQPCISEAEFDIRRRLLLEAQRRLAELRQSLRQRQFDRDQFRDDTLQAIGSKVTARKVSTE